MTADLGTVDLLLGQKYFRFMVVGQNAASAGHAVVIDYVAVTKS